MKYYWCMSDLFQNAKQWRICGIDERDKVWFFDKEGWFQLSDLSVLGPRIYEPH